VRKRECSDNAEQECKALPEVRFGLPLHADRRDGKVHDKREPERIDDPYEDVSIHDPSHSMVVIRCGISVFFSSVVLTLLAIAYKK